MYEKESKIISPGAGIIVLGCRATHGIASAALCRRLEKAWQFQLDEPLIDVVIFSGLGRDQGVIEAEVMEKWWLKRRSQHDSSRQQALFKESMSTTTLQNALFSAALIDSSTKLSSKQRCYYLITCDYHLPRALRLFRKQGLDVVGVAAKTNNSLSQKLSLALREIISEVIQLLHSFRGR